MNTKPKKIIGIIPARYGSVRLPGKPLVDIAGKPMIQRTYEQAIQSLLLDEVVVATDDERIRDVVLGFNGKVAMTSAKHTTGTERIAEVAVDFTEAEIIVDIQGDEPLVEPKVIDAIVEAMLKDVNIGMSNLIVRAKEEDLQDASIVKVVQDAQGFALYCSRSQIPFPRNPFSRYYKIMGIYGFRPDFLQKLARLQPTPLEEAESVEQLRVLEHGYKLKLVETPYDFIGVNTPEDLEKVRAVFSHENN